MLVICGTLLHVNCDRKIGIVDRNVLDRELLRWQDACRAPRVHCCHARFTPEIVDPQEAALQQVQAQPFRLVVAQTRWSRRLTPS